VCANPSGSYNVERKRTVKLYKESKLFLKKQKQGKAIKLFVKTSMFLMCLNRKMGWFKWNYCHTLCQC